MGVLGLFSGPYALLARLACYALLVAGIAGWGAYKMHQHDQVAYHALEVQYQAFQDQTAFLGAQAKKDAIAKDKANQANKEQSDADHKDKVAGLESQLKRLRDVSARGNTVPRAPAASKRPDIACFDRTKLGDAVDDFIADVSRQVGSGASATVDLDSAKGWAGRMSGKLQ